MADTNPVDFPTKPVVRGESKKYMYVLEWLETDTDATNSRYCAPVAFTSLRCLADYIGRQGMKAWRPDNTLDPYALLPDVLAEKMKAVKPVEPRYAFVRKVKRENPGHWILPNYKDTELCIPLARETPFTGWTTSVFIQKVPFIEDGADSR